MAILSKSIQFGSDEIIIKRFLSSIPFLDYQEMLFPMKEVVYEVEMLYISTEHSKYW